MTSGLMAALTHPRVVRGCRVVAGAVFLVAALTKLGDLHSFADQVHNFRLLPLALENLVAMSLPWIELVAGLSLVSGFRARSGGLVVSGLTVVFTVAVVIAMARGLDIECGCFGTADGTRVGLVKVLQNLAILALGLVSSLRSR
jgi:uncharacterized membrane protein YphA (DoxX/SURF4 family)